MKIRYLLLFSAFILTATLGYGQTGFVANEIIVMLKHGTDARLFTEKYNQTHPGQYLEAKQVLSKRTNVFLFEFDSNSISVPGILTGLKDFNGVVLAQPNHNNVSKRSTTPNDLDYPIQWALNGSGGGRISANFAWDIATGGPSALGDTIVIAIIDGGADLQHVDLDFFKNQHEIPGNGIDDDNNGYVDDYDGWNAYNNNGVIASDNHGTHVCGIAGARTNNTEGIAGVMWSAKLMPVAASSSLESVVLAGYGYVLEMRAKYNESNGDSGAFVVTTNSSFGVDYATPADYPIWCAFYDSLGAYGILNAAATANLGIDVDSLGDVPTTCPSDYMIGVTNVNITGNLMAAYGENSIDLAAPGTDIYSTTPNQTYGSKTGTSMATPHVAGTIGLIHATICEQTLLDYAGHPDSLALWIRDVIVNKGVDSLPALAGKVHNGSRLNLQKCLEEVRVDNCMNYGSLPTDDYCDDCNGSVSVQVSGDFGPYVVSLITATDTLTGAATYSDLCTGTYVVRTEDNTGFVKLDTIIIGTQGPMIVTYNITPASSTTSSDGALTALVNGGYPNYDYVWSTGDTTQGILNLPTGTYTTLIKDSHNCSVFDSVFLYTVGVTENFVENSGIRFYPNPGSDVIHILVNNSSLNNSDNILLIRDYLGRVVLSVDISGKTELSLDASSLPSGIYMMEFKGVFSGKLLIK